MVILSERLKILDFGHTGILLLLCFRLTIWLKGAWETETCLLFENLTPCERNSENYGTPTEERKA